MQLAETLPAPTFGEEPTNAEDPGKFSQNLTIFENRIVKALQIQQLAEFGREYRIRTCDIHLVRVALYQLS